MQQRSQIGLCNDILMAKSFFSSIVIQIIYRYYRYKITMVDHSLFERQGLTIEQNSQPDFLAEDFSCVVGEDSLSSSSVISEGDNQGYVEVEGKIFLH